MTSDLIAALLYLISIASLALLFREFTWWRLAASTIACALLMVAKMSGALFIPMAIVLFAVKAALRRPWAIRLAGFPKLRVRTLSGQLAVGAGAAVIHGVVALVVIWGFYGWQQRPAPDWNPALDDYTEPREKVFGGLGGWSPLFRVFEQANLLPDAYLYGLAHTVKNAEKRPSFLNGEYSESGWW